MNCGLLEAKTKSGTLGLPGGVKTPFGGDMSVIRPLAAGEILGCWDVPEKLGLLMDTNDQRQWLMEGMFAPLKIQQSVLEGIVPVMKDTLNLTGREAGVVGSKSASRMDPVK
jgi:hypothetical protein